MTWLIEAWIGLLLVLFAIGMLWSWVPMMLVGVTLLVTNLAGL